jgi:RNA polymerase-binding transcription factor DksA
VTVTRRRTDRAREHRRGVVWIASITIRSEDDHVDENEARQLLLTERERLTALLRDQEVAVGEQQDFDPDPADVAKDIVDRQVDRSALEGVRQELAEVEAALQRLDDGTYGFSDVSGQPIPDERLRAVPHARRLVEEQQLVDNQARAGDPNNVERRETLR